MTACYPQTEFRHRIDWSSDLEVVRRVQAGDDAAFRLLVERYQAKIFSVIHRILRNRQDTEDVAQVTFTKVYFAIEGFDRRCSLFSWICKIAINECYSLLRRRRVRRAYEDVPSDPEIAGESRFGASPEPGADSTTAARDLVNKLLARLPEEDRLLLVLKEVEGHSVGELARMTGATESAVKTKLFRARRKLMEVAERLGRRPAANLECVHE